MTNQENQNELYEVQVKRKQNDSLISTITVSADSSMGAAHKAWKEAIKQGLNTTENSPLRFTVKLLNNHKENQ